VSVDDLPQKQQGQRRVKGRLVLVVSAISAECSRLRSTKRAGPFGHRRVRSHERRSASCQERHVWPETSTSSVGSTGWRTGPRLSIRAQSADDVARFGNLPGVNVNNLPDMSPGDISSCFAVQARRSVRSAMAVRVSLRSDDDARRARNPCEDL
jgi:hypothetical protein